MNKSSFLSSLVSGMVGAFVVLLIQRNSDNPIQEAQILSSSVMRASQFELVDSNGKVRIQLGFSKVSPTSPGIWILDEQGVARGIFGLYQDGSAYMGLQDTKGRMIQLLRSYGPKEAPFHIFKTQGSDQMIMGLNSGEETVPFLMSYKPDHTKFVHFGKYEGP